MTDAKLKSLVERIERLMDDGFYPVDPAQFHAEYEAAT
jgi:hypothetical protein